jgi:hypothetical protein
MLGLGDRAVPGAAALHDGALEEALRELRGEQDEHVLAAGRLSEDRDVRRVAAEGRDVGLHPLERGDLVERAEVARGVARVAALAQRRVPEPAERAEAVVERHHDHAMQGGQAAAVVEARGADGVAAAVDPDHHRQARIGGRAAQGGRVDVEREAVLVTDQRARLGRGVAADAARELRAGGAEGERLAPAGRGQQRLGRAPAQLADRRLGVGDAEPGVAAVLARGADHVACRRLAERRGIGGRQRGRRLRRTAREAETEHETANDATHHPAPPTAEDRPSERGRSSSVTS